MRTAPVEMQEQAKPISIQPIPKYSEITGE